MKYIIVLLTICLCGFALDTGMVNGLVLDAHDEPIAGAAVLVAGTDIGVMTDANGEYLLYNLDPGVITLTARMMGKSSQTIQGVEVIADMTTRVDFVLHEEVHGSTVITVSDQRNLIEYDEIETLHLITANDLESLPVESVRDFTVFQTGSVVAGGNLHIRGGRSGEILYLVDGIPMNDPSDNMYSFDLPMSSISEIRVISGGFSAEYGGAQSGIVSITTRDGCDGYFLAADLAGGAYTEYAGGGESLAGYRMWENQSFRGDALTGEFTVGLPVGLPGTSGLLLSTSRKISGYDRYDSRQNWDNSYRDVTNFVSKLTWKPAAGSRFQLGFYYSDGERGWRDWQWSRIPENFVDDGDTLYYARPQEEALPTRDMIMRGINFSAMQTLSSSCYSEIQFSRYTTEEDRMLRDSLGERFGETWTTEEWCEYEAPDYYLDRDTFHRAGHHPWIRHHSNTVMNQMKFGLTWLPGIHHQIRAGYDGQFLQTSGWDVYAQPGQATWFSEWSGNPRIHGIYLQDRIQHLGGLTCLAGLRMDGLNTGVDGEKAIWRLNPRIGVSHPITVRDMLRVSYGHYFQSPALSLIYWESPSPEAGAFQGNTGLEPEITTGYEIGLKHILAENLLVDCVFFYKTMDGLIATFNHEGTGDYFQFGNSSDNGTATGFEISLDRYFERYWSGTANYTYSKAMGYSSSASATETQLCPLNWDQPHTMNAICSFSVQQGDNILGLNCLEGLSANLRWSYGSGIPYNNQEHGVYSSDTNSERYPWTMKTDIRIEKKFWTGFGTISLYTDVYNLFNRRNIERIYDVMWYEADLNGDGTPDCDPSGPYGNPAAWSPQRHFLFGIRYEFLE